MIRIIDLFAGPGGLGEGFSSFRDNHNSRPFKIVMSVEKEASAHSTLTLRAFLRQFEPEERPADYESYRQGKISKSELLEKWSNQSEQAETETLGRPTALGDDNQIIEERIKELKKRYPNDPWVLIGGPPCQAYSLAGRSRNRGIANYQPENDERNFLYREYLRMLALACPDVFVMENVRGILSAKVSGKLIFEDIIKDLRQPGVAVDIAKSKDVKYKIYSLVVEGENLSSEDYLIKSEDYGVPQRRHRVILLGVRSDLNNRPSVLIKNDRYVSVDDVIGNLPALRSKISKGGDDPEKWYSAIETGITELLRSNNFSDFITKQCLEDYLLDSKTSIKLPTSSYTYSDKKSPTFGDNMPISLARWLKGTSENLDGHEARGHMPADLSRYFYASCYAISNGGVSPKAKDFPELLSPNHANWKSGKFADRFRVQVGNLPSTTITSHISKDGHYFIHPDPTQCRSFTVREAARLQTFPDDYHFEGNRTQQYVQVGNAVPPYLALKIARVVYGILF